MVEAEDTLIAARKVKTEHMGAQIIYVRSQDRGGDARHPPHASQRHSLNAYEAQRLAVTC